MAILRPIAVVAESVLIFCAPVAIVAGFCLIDPEIKAVPFLSDRALWHRPTAREPLAASARPRAVARSAAAVSPPGGGGQFSPEPGALDALIASLAQERGQ